MTTTVEDYYEHLARGDWQYDRDPAFAEFVRLMPAKHWARADLNAVRLGWEAHRAYTQYIWRAGVR